MGIIKRFPKFFDNFVFCGNYQTFSKDYQTFWGRLSNFFWGLSNFFLETIKLPTLSQLPIISGALTFRCSLHSSREGTGVCNRPSEEHLKAKRPNRIFRVFLMHFSTDWRTWTRIAATAYSTDNIGFQKVPRRFLRKGKARARKWSDLPRES